MINRFTYILPLILITIFVSCAKDDHSSSSEQLFPIQLGAGMEEGQDVTRATGAEAAELLENQFFVYGYKTVNSTLQTVFPGYIVMYTANSAATTASNSHGWEYVGSSEVFGSDQTIKYWDAGASEYTFFGVTGKGNGETAPTITDAGVSFTYTLDAALFESVKPEESSANYKTWVFNHSLYISDRWYTNSPSSWLSSPVTLTFRRPFCKVRIMFIDEEGNPFVNNKTLKKESISFKETPAQTDLTGQTQVISNLIQEATFKVTYPKSGESGYTFTTSATSTSATSTLPAITIPYEEKIEATQTKPYFSDSSDDFQKWYTLIPPSATQRSYTLSVTLGSKTKTAVVPEQYMQWKPGYAYTYIFKISNNNDFIVFDGVNVQKWGGKTLTNTDAGYGTAGW